MVTRNNQKPKHISRIEWSGCVRVGFVYVCRLGQTSNTQISFDVEWRTVQSKPLLTLHRRFRLVRTKFLRFFLFVSLSVLLFTRICLYVLRAYYHRYINIHIFICYYNNNQTFAYRICCAV